MIAEGRIGEMVVGSLARWRVRGLRSWLRLARIEGRGGIL